MRLNKLQLLFFSLISSLKCCLSIEADLTMDIQAGKRECFHQFVSQDTSFEVEYQVIEGGDLDVNFMVQSPKGVVLLSELRKSEGVHKIDTREAGDYKICFDNTFSRFSNKLTFFEVITEEPDPNWEKLNELEDLDEMQDSEYEFKLDTFKGGLDDIKRKLDMSRQIQNVLRVYEARDRSTQEHNFERVNFWSGVQLFIMITIGLVQVLMIRSLFADKKASKSMKVST